MLYGRCCGYTLKCEGLISALGKLCYVKLYLCNGIRIAKFLSVKSSLYIIVTKLFGSEEQCTASLPGCSTLYMCCAS